MRRICCLESADLHGISSAQHELLLEVALAHSPRVEDAGIGRVYLDATGLGGLFGDDEVLVRTVVAAAAERGVEVRAGIAGSRLAARFACTAEVAQKVVAPGADRACLAAAPISLLELDAAMSARLARWGLRTVGDLAALPPPQVFERLGADGVRLQRIARGEDLRPLGTWHPPELFEASAQLDWVAESLEALGHVMAQLAGDISDRLTRRGLSADAFDWSCRLADHTRHAGTVTPAFPLNDREDIAALLRTSLHAHPPRGGVEAVTLRARPVTVAPGQSSLVHPTRPSPRMLATTLARIAALVGPHNIGRPVLLDSHAPDAVALEPVADRGRDGSDVALRRAALVLRRCRPVTAAAVTLVGGRPMELRSDRLSGRVVASAGPWRSSGEWWADRPWFSDEWDVELSDGTICRLAHDGSQWALAGIYD